jgi:hypothetical protein
MKPKTKLQKQVAKLSSKLPEITEKQKDWAIKHCFPELGYLRKKSAWCIECGHTWQTNESELAAQLCGITCPHCGKHLNIEYSRKRSFDNCEYYTVITTCKGFQVLRHYVVRKTCHVGYPAKFEVNEAVQNWISPDGKETLLYRSTVMSFYYIDLWDWGSPLEIRHPSGNREKYDIDAKYIYPVRRYIPTLVRNGFKGSFHGISPLDLFKILLSNSMAETLIKTKQYSLLKYLSEHDTLDCWGSVKICIRNHYIVKNAQMWIDYIKMLQALGKDIRSPKYVCPPDLKKAHDNILDKKNAIDAKLEYERKKKELLIYEKEYQKMKSKFLDIDITDGLIDIRTLQSVREFLEEGTAMHHCVFACGYYRIPDSLILSARIKNRRIETVEVSLKTFDVVQSRAVCNGQSEYHQRIVDLVKKNMSLIKKAAA